MASHLLLSSIGAILIAYAVYYINNLRWHSKYKLPPLVEGGVPLFGNALQLPPTGHEAGVVTQGWAKKYGEMFTVKLGSDNWVFLNSSRVVNDLMEKRGAIYISRPKFPMTLDIVSGGGRIVLMPYDDTWRRLRKIMHQILSTRQSTTYQGYQDLESKQLLWDYLHVPEKWYLHNGRYSNSVIMSVVFGRRASWDDPELAALFETAEEFLELQQPGVNIVDAFPVLAKLPKFLQWWRPRGEKVHKKTVGVYRRVFETMEKKIAEGTQKECFATEYLKIAEKENFNENQKFFTAGTLLEAGSDTTRVSLGQMIAGAATYPDWVIRARKELDSVCGKNAERLPQWSDQEKLPYITAVVKESFRWRPNIAPLGAPTLLIKDDEYEGYKFPKGTVFTWNAWAIALDEKEYPEPLRFYPERFINKDLNNALQGHWGFGPGRRVCVGWNVGQQNMFIATARLLYCFDFIEDPANPINTMTIPQLTHGKPPFNVKIKVRSEAHAELIRRDCLAATQAKY